MKAPVSKIKDYEIETVTIREPPANKPIVKPSEAAPKTSVTPAPAPAQPKATAVKEPTNKKPERTKVTVEPKIEKVKELLMYDELTLSEIAFKLNYSSVGYLSNQFKKVTGLTPSSFKLLKDKNRQSIADL